MAVKIVRQPKKIALIGAPSSAAAFSAGSEKAPAALRAAGLAEKLQAAGFEVVDYGDCAPRLFANDDEHRRARNMAEIVASLNDLKTRAELAVKSGALVLVLGGDCAQVIGLLTGAPIPVQHLAGEHFMSGSTSAGEASWRPTRLLKAPRAASFA